MKSINIIAIMPFLASSFMTQAPVYQDVYKRQPYNSLNNSGYSQDFFNNAQSLISLTQDFSKMVTPGLKANVKFSWDAYNAQDVYKRQSQDLRTCPGIVCLM